MSSRYPYYSNETVALALQVLDNYIGPLGTTHHNGLAAYMGITPQELEDKIQALIARQYSFLAQMLNHDTD